MDLLNCNHNVTACRVFEQLQEHTPWSIAHTYSGATLYLFIQDFPFVMLLLYIWESFEASSLLIAGGYPMFAQVAPGAESAPNSLIVDPFLGFFGMLMCAIFVRLFGMPQVIMLFRHKGVFYKYTDSSRTVIEYVYMKGVNSCMDHYISKGFTFNRINRLNIYYTLKYTLLLILILCPYFLMDVRIQYSRFGVLINGRLITFFTYPITMFITYLCVRPRHPNMAVFCLYHKATSRSRSQHNPKDLESELRITRTKIKQCKTSEQYLTSDEMHDSYEHSIIQKGITLNQLRLCFILWTLGYMFFTLIYILTSPIYFSTSIISIFTIFFITTFYWIMYYILNRASHKSE